MSKISIIVPCYNEDEALPLFYKEIVKVSKEMKSEDFEFLFVNDGSIDKTLIILRGMAEKDKRVRYVSFSRNFGKEAAIYAGLEYSTGDYVAVMDADLQDPPSLLPKMYKLICDDHYDCVGTRRVTRKGEPPIRSFFARCFYKLINKMSKVQMVDGARDFQLMTRQMADSVISMKEYNRYSKGLFSFVGFNVKWLEYENIQRVAGETKWNFWKLFLYAIDGIVSFSTMPLTFSLVLGLLFSSMSFIGIIALIIKLCLGLSVSKTGIVIFLILFVGGINLIAIGIMGQYLSRMYLEVKNRPIYIVKETEKN